MVLPRYRRQLIAYWFGNAESKLAVMETLYKNKKYSDALFFGHLALECILKAIVVQATKDHAPRTHNLTRLAELGKLTLTLEQKKFLAQVNEFNLQARYPDVKFMFYKQCTKKFTDRYRLPIRKFFHVICQELKRKK